MALLQDILVTTPSQPDKFALPSELEAATPPELRGLRRDEVRLMVSHYQDDRIQHGHFADLPAHLRAGDVLVINTSGTMKASLPATRADGTSLRLNLSMRQPDGNWVVELRRERGDKTQPFWDARAGEIITLPDDASALLLAPYRGYSEKVRLWEAVLDLHGHDLHVFLKRYGMPVRYSYVPQAYPIDYYQTVYATETGSAEMPSAGRAFTPELITQLVARGIQFAPLILHTGVASLEAWEPPYAEYYRVPAPTAGLVNAARREGRRVIGVGTTVVRALETVTEPDGDTAPGEGWTELVITPERGLHAVTGMLTGFHEPQATHLDMLRALAGAAHIQRSYRAALEHRYLWHEFGDLHLILP